jgi:hypothetical protein
MRSRCLQHAPMVVYGELWHYCHKSLQCRRCANMRRGGPDGGASRSWAELSS